jgi:type VI secretion system secreted protein Hcp
MKRKLITAAVTAALVVGGAATYAFASRSDTSQTINACVGQDGKFRLIAVGDACRPAETAISWNTTGPAGATGPQGLAGRDGRDGQPGPQGPPGPSAANPDAVTATVMIHGAKTGDFSQTPIDVTAISHEIVSPRDPASGLPTGQRQHKPIVLTMGWGASTPRLLNSLVTNENLSTVSIALLSDGNQVATIKLTNANIAQYDQHGDQVTFQFTYQKIEWTWLDGGITASDDWEQTP